MTAVIGLNYQTGRLEKTLPRPIWRRERNWDRTFSALVDVLHGTEMMRDRADPHPRERTLLIAHQDPPLGVPLDEAATASPQRDIPSKSAPLQKTAPQAESAFVKVCGCRPHEGGAARTGAGVRKPPREETAGCVERPGVRRYGDFGAGGLLPSCIERLFGKRSRG